MRTNITTAPVFPGDAADGAAVVGMIIGGAGPWVGFREKNIPLAPPATAPAMLASRNARHPSARHSGRSDSPCRVAC